MAKVRFWQGVKIMAVVGLYCLGLVQGYGYVSLVPGTLFMLLLWGVYSYAHGRFVKALLASIEKFVVAATCQSTRSARVD